jgi:superfamily I DNA/RNA helicase
LIAAEFLSPHAPQLRGSLPPKGADPAWGGPAPDQLLTAEDKDNEDGIPLLKPVSCGRDGEAPIIIRLPSLREEVAQMVDQLSAAHQEGHAWGDMAMICRTWGEMEACGRALKQRGLPHQVRKGSGTFNPAADTIKVLTMHVSKGLEFPVVALVGVGHMPAANQSKKDEARLFYVGATRSKQRKTVGLSGAGEFATCLAA